MPMRTRCADFVARLPALGVGWMRSPVGLKLGDAGHPGLAGASLEAIGPRGRGDRGHRNRGFRGRRQGSIAPAMTTAGEKWCAEDDAAMQRVRGQQPTLTSWNLVGGWRDADKRMAAGKMAGWKSGCKKVAMRIRSLDVLERGREREKSPVLDAKLEMREGARPKRSEATTQGGMRVGGRPVKFGHWQLKRTPPELNT